MIEILIAIAIILQTSAEGEPLIYGYHGLAAVVVFLVVVGVARVARRIV